MTVNVYQTNDYYKYPYRNAITHLHIQPLTTPHPPCDSPWVGSTNHNLGCYFSTILQKVIQKLLFRWERHLLLS